ncbi:hypothetical protein NI17_013555 [Thermobifida halotolerans]|uniref:Uncharacterized protein n=1 Tax=Thermobifida halotolerans TaxID=483545 RepID=A0A399G388_9ACTN|nr:hypothetical protein [Thermobifida halotolerans]UOE17898.1 hypothetical protein NI17_013555 [Thermobifida halotolerans]
MATEKISVTFPEAVVSEARRIAREQGVSLSAYLAQATQEANRRAETLAILAEIRAEIGELTPAEAAQIDAEIAADEARFLNAERMAS